MRSLWKMIWQAPENKALGICVITTGDSCDMSCTNSEGVAVKEGGGKKVLPLSFSTEHVHI